jgi:hypothetical protein
MKRYIIVTIASLAYCAPANAECSSPADCAYEKFVTAAFTPYSEALTPILQQLGANPTVELMIAQRRLQEKYCLQVARCEPDAAVLYAINFDKCLGIEALDHYEEEVQEQCKEK